MEEQKSQTPAVKGKKRGAGGVIVRIVVILLILALLFCLGADILYNLGYISPQSAVGRAVVNAESALLGAAGPALDNWQEFWADKGGPGLDRAVRWVQGIFS